MKNKEKLLIVSAISPFPKTSGGAVRIYNTIKYLSEQFELYFIFFIPQGTSLNNDDKIFLKEKTKLSTHFYQKSQKNYFSFINEFQPYWFSDWLDDELKIFLPKIIKKYNIKNIQIEFTQLLYLNQFIPKNVKSIYVAHDISTVSFWRRLFEVKNPINFFVHCFRWIQIYIYEKYYLPLFDLVISMSNIDKNMLINKYNCKNVVVKQNGVENINFLKKRLNQTINLGYIGSFNHPPNRTAITYFLNEIAPQLERNRIKYKYFIAGDNNREDIKTIINRSELKNKKNIVNLRKVKDVEDFYKKIDILIAPILSGSGTRIKILEALSFGVPVITTTIGKEGIDFNSDYLNTAKDASSFIFEIKKIKNSQSKIISMEDFHLKKLIQPLIWVNIFKNYLVGLFK